MRQKMTFLSPDHDVQFNSADTVLSVAIRNEIEISHSCGGMGSCGTCLVKVRRGLEKLGERTALEQEIAQDRGFEDFERLSCQTRPCDGLAVEVPEARI